MRDFSKIRCVVFDLDDTLWPCEPTILNAEMELYKWLERQYPRITNEYSLEDLREHRANLAIQSPHIAHDVTAIRKRALAKLAEKFGYPLSLAIDGIAVFRRHRNKVELFDDALPTIHKLNDHFKTGVITNGNADLDAIGMSDYFDFIVTAEEAGSAKPDQAIFEYARCKINLEKHELLYVGDHPINDVLGSSNSGWKSLWFNPSGEIWLEGIRPDAEIKKLSELPSLLAI